MGVNELPLSLVLSWYEQKAVAILLTLLHLGIKDIRLGPTLPAFITPNVLDVLIKNFDIKPIAATPEEDLEEIPRALLVEDRTECKRRPWPQCNDPSPTGRAEFSPCLFCTPC